MKNLKNLRVLTQFEQDVITQALEYYKDMPLVPSTFRWAAKSMLEQKMPEQMFWGTE